jgi:hypothetical protein
MSSPTITFTALGRISLNSAATRTLEREAVEFVLLAWDKDRQMVAIRPTRKKDTRTYHVSFGKKGNSAGFSAKTFMDYIRFDYSETRTMSAVWNESENQLEAKIAPEHLKSETAIEPIPVRMRRKTTKQV